MPCYDPPYPPTRLEILTAKVSAILCGIVRSIGPEKVLEVVDWAQAGVAPAEFLEWWKLHQEQDTKGT